MPKVIPLDPASEWVELSSTEEDWDRLPSRLLMTMLVQLYLIRAFEEEVLQLAGQGLVHGPAHSSIGQEGGAVGSCLSLRSDDQVTGSHRGHHQFLAKALGHVAPDGLEPTTDLPSAVREVLERSLAEICGLAAGYCRGRGGSMHLQWREAGAMGTNAIVGGAVPQAAGFAWSDKHAGTDAVSVTYFGDGAVNIGSVLETFNLAGAWKVPVCFFIENNHYAVSTTPEEATGEPRLSARGLGFAIPSWRVDGMDPVAVHLATGEAVAHMRAGGGPTLIEADVYRYFHQNGPFPGSAFGYRTKDEEQGWRERDPLIRVAANLVRRELLSEDDIAQLWRRAKDTMKDIAERLMEPDPDGKPGAKRYRAELLPDPAFVDAGIRGDLSELAGLRYMERSEYEGEVNPIRRIYPDALMEHLGHAAAEAESEEEAEAFIGALVPLAARFIPRAASAVMRVAPNLIRGVAGAARTLRANPATRPLVRALPTVVRRTTANLARQAQAGRRVTPQTAVRTLARQTSRVIGSPAQCAQAYRRSRALDRNYHRSAGPVASATGPAAALPAATARSLASGAARPAAHLCAACRHAVNGAR